jgi:hypothetical protein
MKRSTWSEPALIVAVLQAVVALIVALGTALSAKQAGSIEAVAAALGALIVAASVHPFQVPALTGLLTAAGTVLVAFGVKHVSIAEVSMVNVAVTAILAAFVRTQVTPVAHLVPVATGPPA